MKEQAAQYGHLAPGQQPPPPHPGAQITPPPGAAPPGTQLGTEAEGAVKEESKGKQPEGKPENRVPKPSVSSEEEKTDDADELGDFLGMINILCFFLKMKQHQIGGSHKCCSMFLNIK